ncbi:ABC transporter ATP-binding protein/permease [Gordonibacter massiliensis (ex Traore et al. 2017)]|uniref:ABC transporter ATP-binding protein/permease n=1 Tax=Gordonibacter massiliensis (ex Traore et al. 2017) TaxID=1841863 RepID=UPI001C8C616C|nr:ABC transporter ATP-binding protein/permease [Gordonibacter massiliensis (ex Traore et al. 2017)]MBX9032870.1 ABC transporter ATP-binding protein/permease [Gordonibacter massiliensis (ex Traore et al. 2017)]
MLQLLNIRKSYTTGTFTQVALDDVSISFRDNEFVAILGPSGSGKTTLLNIVGGLDHYDSGNLVIDGISTEQYKDRDWDAYRNNRIGFVFQSYNLIPHQTVLSNVELALTLSGVSHAERRERAVKALEEVGLGEHVDKKPSQLSGGQMQRVAIARALINDPEILLADEPTGALDSKTSVQVMDLLTDIAKDRLVIMVTHNPELAEQYANRIVNLSDGVIRSDSNPYDPTAQEMHESEKPVRKTGMSFFTALALSFNNLMTKKGRTLMTAFAGSIGIIGIAAILALANGVNNYIKSVEEDTLSEYPLQIQSTGFDMTSMMLGAAAGGAGGGSEGSSEEKSGGDDSVRVVEMVTNMFSSIGSNDLASLKEYFDSGESDIDKYTNAIEYSYNVAPQIYSSNTEKIRQVNPDKSFSALGLGSTTSSNSLMSMSMSTDMFSEMPSDPGLYEYQYDVKAGRWPENHDECVVVLTGNGSMSDLMLYTLGLRNTDELDTMVKQFAAEEEVTTPTDIEYPSYEDIMGVTFKLVKATDYYVHDDEFGVWKDKTDDTNYMRDLVANGEDIKIVGVVQPAEGASATMLSSGINYPSSLTDYVIDQAADSTIVKDQLAHPDTNVFTGKPFGEEDDSDSGFNMDSLFTIDGDAIQAAFTIDQSKLSVDMSNALNLQGSLQNMPAAPAPNMEEIGGSLNIDLPVDKVSALMANLMQGYAGEVQKFYAANAPYIENPNYDKTDPASLPVIPNPSYNPNAKPPTAQEWMDRPEIKAQIMAGIQGMVDQDALQAQLATALQGYVQTTMTTYMTAMASELQTQVTSALQQSMNQMANNMASAMSIDPDKFQDAFKMNMSEEELGELMMSMMGKEDASYDNNLKKLGYADFNKPGGIDIYPIDFESKEKVIDILDAYNDRMTADGQEDKVITYTDFVGTLMSSVTDIVNMISYVLVAFVAISLVVSSIMIGVITYISVLERKKEIGILRSIGASKGDISRVFNAETIIVGFTAGVIGIGVTALACIPANAIVYANFDVANVASLPWQAAIILIAISVFLTFLAGLIPSSAASRKDPVEALRSE